jgi:hypothetical protein
MALPRRTARPEDTLLLVSWGLTDMSSNRLAVLGAGHETCLTQQTCEIVYILKSNDPSFYFLILF